jgi:hypothetical protein
MTRYIKRALGVSFAIEIIIVMSWCIWKERNAWILTTRIPQLITMFKKEFALVIQGVKERDWSMI